MNESTHASIFVVALNLLLTLAKPQYGCRFQLKGVTGVMEPNPELWRSVATLESKGRWGAITE